MYIIVHISAQLSALKAVPMVENALILECVSAAGSGKGIVVLLVSLVHWIVLYSMWVPMWYACVWHVYVASMLFYINELFIVQTVL